jgi:hypothetical protein
MCRPFKVWRFGMNRESRIAEKIANRVADAGWKMSVTNYSNYTTIQIWNDLEKVSPQKLEDYIKYLEGRMYIFKFIASNLIVWLKGKGLLSGHVDRISEKIIYETFAVSFYVNANRALTVEEEVELRKTLKIRG